jgi:hypothetical protein
MRASAILALQSYNEQWSAVKLMWLASACLLLRTALRHPQSLWVNAQVPIMALAGCWTGCSGESLLF